MHTIVTLTLNPTIDISTSVDHVVPEHKLRCAASQAAASTSRVQFRNWAAPRTRYLASGPSGAILQQLLDREGLTHTPTPIAGWTRESFTVLD
jgi:6-phosphofructokinase 2